MYFQTQIWIYLKNHKRNTNLCFVNINQICILKFTCVFWKTNLLLMYLITDDQFQIVFVFMNKITFVFWNTHVYFECDFCTFVFWYSKFETQICISKYTCAFKIHMCISKVPLYNLPSDDSFAKKNNINDDTNLLFQKPRKILFVPGKNQKIIFPIKGSWWRYLNQYVI